MAYNEILLIASSLLCATMVIAAWKLDRERLHSIILIFLILIGVAGGKIVEFFGFVTNTGNVFYAGVFLATYFLIERYGRREGLRSIWVGTIGVLSFFTLLFSVLALVSSESTDSLSALLSSAFGPAPRLACASLLAYMASQSLNVYLYTYLKGRFDNGQRRRVWLRVNVSNICAQLLDSIAFFTIAFWGVVAPADIGEILLTGFVIKVLFVMIFSPLLYLNRIEEEEGQGYSSILLR